MNSSPIHFLQPGTLQTQRNWKLVLSYDGTDFHGWQVQPGLRTIQGELASAIERVTGEQVLPQGSGRTDAGVHALAQVASFTLAAAIPAYNLQRALNRTLPPDVRVLAAEPVEPSFHARHSARHKTYEYRIYRGEICPPFLARYASALNWPLDLGAMREAANAVLGEHDFTSFAAADPDLAQRSGARESGTSENLDRDNIRTIYESAWEQRASDGGYEGDLLLYRVRGSGFLHHMVRNLVGTFLEAGRGQILAEELPRILAARERAAAGPTAPARGLFLVSVGYSAM
ncbi:MAG TPA: tRNA pseudouridine(38-40) synthase TruA [Acidisarcina sp.]|nr:tRNA pseudouridine(38-40) synthase TruA [Acidisarcina sp.]